MDAEETREHFLCINANLKCILLNYFSISVIKSMHQINKRKIIRSFFIYCSLMIILNDCRKKLQNIFFLLTQT